MMLRSSELEMCYLSFDAFVLIAMLHEIGVEDFDLALELTRKALGDERTYCI